VALTVGLLVLGRMMVITSMSCFCSAKVVIPVVVRVLKCNSTKLMFEEFSLIKMSTLDLRCCSHS